MTGFYEMSMGRTALTLSIVLALTLSGRSQGRNPGSPEDTALPLARTEPEKRILSVLDEMRKSGKTYLSVPVSDGRVLRLLTEAVGAKTVVEIGTSTGYSGLWFCLALQKTGGKLTTFEIDSGRAATARKHFEQAGVAQLVNVIEGDAHAKLAGLKGPIDLAFIDADKEGYVDYLNKVLPLLRPGGLILAHNTTMAVVKEGYIKQVLANPDLETIFYNDGGGLGVTVKKR
jgi:caffeoyl-CoA O-methyltransferase